MWNNLIGVTVTLVIGYLISLITGGEEKEIGKLTIKGQKQYFEKENFEESKDNIYIMPGKFEKASYALLAYFVIAFILLYLLGA